MLMDRGPTVSCSSGKSRAYLQVAFLATSLICVCLKMCLMNSVKLQWLADRSWFCENRKTCLDIGLEG